MRVERELMRGAGPVAVLKLLEEGDKYGYELVEALQNRRAVCLIWGSRRSIHCFTICSHRGSFAPVGKSQTAAASGSITH